MFDYMLHYLFIFCKNSGILAPPISLWNSPSELLERLYHELKSSVMPQIENNPWEFPHTLLLGLHTLTAEGLDSIPHQETKTP